MKTLGPAFHFAPIGFVQSPFKDRFGVPRQPGLVTEARGVLKFANDPDLKTALRSVEEFSHIWLVFVFHDHGGRNWKPSIRPPRLGGVRKVGVLSSRSPHRPNPIGISALTLVSVNLEAEGGPELHVSGLDVIDGTPILDIKPYIAYADSIPTATAGWASAPIPRAEVKFTTEADAKIEAFSKAGFPRLKAMLTEMLEIDPRPAFQKRKLPVKSVQAQGTRYGFQLLDFDVKYEIRDGHFLVYDLILSP